MRDGPVVSRQRNSDADKRGNKRVGKEGHGRNLNGKTSNLKQHEWTGKNTNQLEQNIDSGVSVGWEKKTDYRSWEQQFYAAV